MSAWEIKWLLGERCYKKYLQKKVLSEKVAAIQKKKNRQK
jgi:hypothetical protein